MLSNILENVNITVNPITLCAVEIRKSKNDKKAIDNGATTAYSDLNDTLASLSPDEQKIVSALKNGERLVDDVIAESGKSAGVILASLTLLEVKGMVRRLPGKFIELTGK